MFKIRAKVWNPFDRLKEAEVELVVDSGTTYTVLLKSLLESLKVKPIRMIRLRLTDSRVVEKALRELASPLTNTLLLQRQRCSAMKMYTCRVPLQWSSLVWLQTQ